MSNRQQRTTEITKWLYPEERAASITIWPLSDGAHRYAELDGRVSLAIYAGDATLSLRPTAAEVRSIIAALEWALTASPLAVAA
jgi:hypothetical protein